MSRPTRLTRVAAAVVLAIGLTACTDSPEKTLAKAKESIEKQDFKSAEIHLKNYLQKQDSAEARFMLGGLHRRVGDMRSAEKEFRRALELGQSSDQVVPVLVDAMLQTGQFEQVIQEAGKYTLKDPSAQARLLTTSARANVALGKVDEGTRQMKAALAVAPDHIPARVGLLAIDAAKGDPQGALAAVDKILEQSPDAFDALYLKGDLLLAMGRGKDARDAFGKVVALEPGHRQARARIAAISIDLGEIAEARKALEELRKLAPGAPITLHLVALADYREKKFESARDNVLNVLKNAPDYLQSVNLAADVFLALGNLEQAEKYARQLVEKAPRSTQGYRQLAAVHLRANAPDKALQALQPALEGKTSDATLYAMAGEAALKTGDAARATQYFELAAKLDPKDPAKLTGLAMARLASGDSAGIGQLEAASALDPKGTQADLALVMSHLRARQYDKALAAVDRLETKQPGSAIAANLRGTVFAAKGDAARARAAFAQALERDPKFVAAVTNLAALELRADKPDDAKKHLLAFLEREPKNVQAIITLARVVAQTEGKEGEAKAFDLLKKARQADPTSLAATLALNSQYARMGQHKDAIPMLQEAVTGNPTSIELLDALGTAYLRSDQESQAMETFEKILKLKPDNATLHYQLGQLKLRLKDNAGALANLRKAAELDPKSSVARIGVATALLQDGKLAEARVIATQLQKDLPKSTAGLVLEGDIFAVDGKWSDAAASYRKAMAQDRQGPIVAKLHNALVRSGKDAEAQSVAADWLRASPQDQAMRMYLADFELGRKNWKQAVAHYDAVLAAQPNNAAALNNAAWALHQTRDPGALKLAERAYTAAPQQPAVLDTLGVILVDLGQTERGVTLLKQAVAAAPKNPELRLHLAAALAKTGDKTGARKEIEAILNTAPDSPAAQAARTLNGSL